MKLKILAVVFVVGTLLTFSTGCDICDIFNCPGPQPEPKPEPGKVLFFDDFEDGADPAWSAASGTWIVERQRFTVREERSSGWLNVYVKTADSQSWEDYAVEVDIYDATKTHWGAIIVRAQDDLNKVVFQWRSNWDDIVWHVYVDGKESEVRAIASPGLTDRARVRIEAVGNTYTAYVRQGEQGELIKRLSFTDDTFTRGMPGLALYLYERGKAVFDNFKVMSLGQ